MNRTYTLFEPNELIKMLTHIMYYICIREHSCGDFVDSIIECCVHCNVYIVLSIGRRKKSPHLNFDRINFAGSFTINFFSSYFSSLHCIQYNMWPFTAWNFILSPILKQISILSVRKEAHLSRSLFNA